MTVHSAQIRAELSSNGCPLKLRGAGMIPHFHAELPSISRWSDREEDGVSHLTLPMAGTAGFLALAVSFVQLDDFPYWICWSTGYYCGGLPRLFRRERDGGIVGCAHSRHELSLGGGGGLRNMNQKGSGVPLSCFPWFVFFFAFVGWLGLGFIPGLSPPRSQESRMRLPPSMVHVGHGIQRR